MHRLSSCIIGGERGHGWRRLLVLTVAESGAPNGLQSRKNIRWAKRGWMDRWLGRWRDECVDRWRVGR